MSFSVYGNDDYTSIVFFILHEVNYSKKYKLFLKKMPNWFLRLAFKLYFVEFIFAIDLSKLCFSDQTFAI